MIETETTLRELSLQDNRRSNKKSKQIKIKNKFQTLSKIFEIKLHFNARHFSQSIYPEGSTRRRTSLLKRKVGQRTTNNCLG